MAKKTKSHKQIRRPQKHSNSPLKLLVLLAVIALGGFFVYSVYSYQTSEQEKEGFFTCNADKTVCELSQHVHADIHMDVCGELVTFPKETGRTDMQHTHKETNKLHWHARVKVDPMTRAPLDPTLQTVQAFLDQMKYNLPEACTKNSSPLLEVRVNDVLEIRGLQYVWKDGDRISVTYK